ncbi:putative transposase [Stackebrandtia albiflava]|uniref:Putative transposase n=1 Tax=Stackebrandtia albiflava TaxID=406432 RepID=A0A562VDZ3_9ACTN|nr:putative transposase [Stackebrandtia albiflava]
MCLVQLRYRYRVYPSPGQRIALAKAFGCARVVFNDAVAARKQAYRSGSPYPTTGELSKKLITEAKKTPGREFLAEVSAVVLQQALADCDRAHRNFFDSVKGKRKGAKLGPPRFKKRSARQSIRFTRNARFRVLDNKRLRLPKIGDLDVRWSRRLPAEPSSVTVVKDSTGKYFASFVVDIGEPEPLPDVADDTGIDLGLSSFAVLKGRVITSPKFFRQAERKLRKASRELSRKQQGSKNRAKARVTLAKVHARIANRRRDFIEQATTAIVRENQAVYVEDLNVKGMATRKGRRGKSVHDQALGAFLRALETKCARYGRGFARVDRWFPSTRMCSACAAITGPKGLTGLSVRQWTCPCGTHHDRDVNAQINIRNEGRRILADLAAGQAESLNACGAQIRPDIPAPRRETGTHRSDLDNRADTRIEDTVGTTAL